MNDEQMFEFNALISRLASVLLRVRQDSAEFRALTTSYFRALRRYSVRDLERAADVWIERETKFPKPAEWAGAIPRQEMELRTLSEADAAEYLRAERARWQGPPCGCAECQEADVAEKPIRFVPLAEPDGRDVRVRLSSDKVVVAGEWIHGWALHRYYAARADFYAKHVEIYGLQGETPSRPSRALRQRVAALLNPAETVFRTRSEFEPMLDRADPRLPAGDRE